MDIFAHLWDTFFKEKTSLLPMDGVELEGASNDVYIYVGENKTTDMEEDDEEEEETDTEFVSNYESLAWPSEDQYIAYVCSKMPNKSPVTTEDFYFDMIFTLEWCVDLKTTVKIWWLHKCHPYALMIKEANIKEYQSTKKQKYPIYTRCLNVVAYHDTHIQIALESIKTMYERCKTNLDNESQTTNN
jgi:hypothetical protein